MISTGERQRFLSQQPFSPCEERRKSSAACQSQSCQCVRQPFCDESGVGFVAPRAENSTALWSHHSILRSDETWLSEWSGTDPNAKRRSAFQTRVDFPVQIQQCCPVAHECIALTIHFQVHVFDGPAMCEVDLVSLQRQRPNPRSRRSNAGPIGRAS